MVNAIYQKPENTVPVTNMYDETLSYDKNGNIQTLLRNGDFDSNIYSAIQIDNLTYTYDTDNKNQLRKVNDASNSPKGFKDIGAGYDDYTYDDFGNMKSDDNKGIDSISYNHLNLPVKIYFATGNRIEYLYDATGKKLRKKVFLGNEVAPTDYLDGFQYVDEQLNFFPQAEGYVNVTPCAECEEPTKLFDYVYQYKDHLGNIRVSYGYDQSEEVLKIIEENHYYPFGLKHTNYNIDEKKYEPSDNPTVTQIGDLAPGEQLLNKYKYNGKEWQDELGLAMYDYGARNYDPGIGRWMNMDPLAEKDRRWTPYKYCYNNPLRFTDPDGMGESDGDDYYIDDRTGKILGQDGADTNDVRIIDARDYNKVKESNNGSTTSPEATAQLQNADVSKIVTINNTQIQNELQQVNDLSRKSEAQTYIVLDRANAEVKAMRGEQGTEGVAIPSYETRELNNVEYNTVGGNLLLGIAHGHNLTTDALKINIPGTSPQDKDMAMGSGLTIYAIDAYNTAVGGQAKINRVTSNGKESLNVGTTKGASGTGNFNLGLDALKLWSGF